MLRLKHDWQIGKARQALPETVPFYLAPKFSAGKNQTKLPSSWQDFQHWLNRNNLDGERYLFDGALAGLYLSGFPSLTSLSFGGNVIRLLDVIIGDRGKWGLIDTMSSYNSPPSDDYSSDPVHVHKHVVIRRAGLVVNPRPGDLYFPLVSNRPLYVPLSFLESFPELPNSYIVVASSGLKVRASPNLSSNRIRVLNYQDSITVFSYHPTESEVWGEVSDGWICLCYYPRLGYGPYYFTSWGMETLPPPPPSI